MTTKKNNEDSLRFYIAVDQRTHDYRVIDSHTGNLEAELENKRDAIDLAELLNAQAQNNLIWHPVWCNKQCCVESPLCGDVYHESQPVTRVFAPDPKVGTSPFTGRANTGLHYYPKDTDRPLHKVIVLENDETQERFEMWLDSPTLHELAHWLTERAEEFDALLKAQE